MADTNGGDVERHFLELEKQLVEDGFADDHLVMRTTKRLLKALRNDGFAFKESSEEMTVALEVEEEPVVVAAAAPELPEPTTATTKTVTRAFLVKDKYDTHVLASLFSEIDGWRTEVVPHKGRLFVVATNSKRLPEGWARQACREYVVEKKQAQA